MHANGFNRTLVFGRMIAAIYLGTTLGNGLIPTFFFSD